MPTRVLPCILAFLLLWVSVPSMARERILSYHSEIDIAPDAGMTVQESIRVVAEGKQIQRGIYRDFPTSYRDRFGNTYTVKFEVMEVTRDGEPEPWHIRKRSNGVRIYAGSSDVFLSPGEYEYTFTYQTDRQIGFFADHDELYWNVTGNGWDFSIDRASAAVRLPVAVDPAQITLSGYTGKQGDTGANYAVSVGEGIGLIETRSALNPHEGLTLVMGWPKGVLSEPGALQRFFYLLGDNLGLVLALIALVGTIIYLLLMWVRYGRDPPPGVVFPHYEPPAGYSPASARYINKMRYDDNAFAAAVINLAVKGHLSIACKKGDYTLARLTSTEDLARGEGELLNKLFTSGTALELKNSNHEQISAARTAHKRSLQRDYRHQYFKTNAKLLLPAFLGSLVLFAVILITAAISPLVLVIYGFIIAVHVLFLFLMRAPSPRGRRLMDKFDGFKLYLEVAEKDDLNLQHPPDLTPRLFEKYLPFAVALGVEQQWAERFSQVFAGLQSQGEEAYTPAWYHGSFNSTRMGDFTNSVSSQFAGAISSSARAPGSSSGGGGGGSSGGGGGGGGGGGW